VRGTALASRPHGEEGVGLDVVLHGEEAYAKNEGAVLVHPDVLIASQEVDVHEGMVVAAAPSSV